MAVVIIIFSTVQQIERLEFNGWIMSNPAHGVVFLLTFFMKVPVKHYRPVMRIEYRIIKRFVIAHDKFFNFFVNPFPGAVTLVFIPRGVFKNDAEPVNEVPLGICTSPGSGIIKSQNDM